MPFGGIPSPDPPERGLGYTIATEGAEKTGPPLIGVVVTLRPMYSCPHIACYLHRAFATALANNVA